MAQKTVKEICPVCGNQIQEASVEFCPQCHWEIITISDSASQGLKNFYSEKLKRHQEIFNQTEKLSEIANEKSQLIDRLEKQITDLEAKNKLLASEVANQKPLTDKVKSLEQAITDNEKRVKQLSDNLEKEKEKLTKEKAAHQATKSKSPAYKFNPK